MEPAVGNMQRQFCIIVVLSLIVGLQAWTCPSGFTLVRNKCYSGSLEKVNWFEADRRCRAMDASLMTFDNEYDRIISTNYMKTIGISFDYKFFGGVWMGINCLGKSRQFVASHDGGRVPFVKWLPLQPDNANGRSTEECVAYSDVNGYGFNDDSCATAHQYVCQTRFKYY